jgi:hypothetical protein
MGLEVEGQGCQVPGTRRILGRVAMVYAGVVVRGRWTLDCGRGRREKREGMAMSTWI